MANFCCFNIYTLNSIHIWDDGSLEIINVTKLDEGRYTCFAENNRGKANSTGVLEMTGKPLLCICLFRGESSSSKSLIFSQHCYTFASQFISFLSKLMGVYTMNCGF